MRIIGTTRRPVSHFHRLCAVTTTLMVALAIVGCGTSGSSESGSSGAKKIKVTMNFIPGGLQSPMYLAKEKGYYSDLGLDVELIAGKGSQFAVNDVDSGNTDIAFAGSPNVMLGAAKGQNVISVANIIGMTSFGFFVPKDSGIKSISDLKGKTIISTAGTPQAAIMPAIFDINGLSMSDVSITNVAASALLSSYAGGAGDAIVTSIPYGIPIIEPKRPSNTLYWKDFGLIIPDYSIVVTNDMLKDEPETIKKFLEATLKAWAEAIKDPTASIKAVMKDNPVQKLESGIEEFNGFKPLLCAPGTDGKPLGYHDPELWDSSVKTLTKVDLIKSDMPATDYYSNTFFEGPDAITTVKCPIENQ